MKPYHNILIIKPGAIGDLLQLTPVLRALRALFPASRISLLVGSAATAELFRHNPHVHETIVYEKKGEHRSLPSFLRLWQRLHAARYDLVLNFQRSNLKTWLLAASAFPCRVLVYHKSDRRDLHAVVNHLETIGPLGASSASLDLELFPGPEDRSFARGILASWTGDGRPVIALNPGASHPVNRWSAGQFSALADLLEEKLNAHIVIVGGTEDVKLAEDVARGTRSKPLSMAGKATLLQLAALLEQCDLLVSGDTGPLHVAAAVGTRVAALFGAADPARTGPVGRGHRVIRAEDAACVPCRSRSCENSVHLDCMKKITPEKVFSVAADMLRSKQGV
jgi:ADP-heptose:LPS heptosyltransferase